MDGAEITRRASHARRLYKLIPLIALGLSLMIIANVYSVDIFSLVFSQASGTNTLTGGKVTVDISNAYQGYIMVQFGGTTDKRLKARISYNGTEYPYDLNSNGEYETYPLQFGSGKYGIEVLENVKGTSYSRIFNKSFNVELNNENAAFLCPNQYVWYTPSTEAVAKSFEICDGLTDNMAKAKALYNYVGDNVMYDYMKALTVQKGYMPDVDETLNTRMGICFDYSSLLACMMRVQGIPTKIVIGNLITMNQYHAWNLALIDGSWVLLDATFKNSNYSASDYDQERFY